MFVTANVDFSSCFFLLKGLDWMRCPMGTYSNSEQLSSEEQCSPCDPGFFCNGTARTSPTNPCDPGYFCKSGVVLPNPEPAASGCETVGNLVHPSIGDVCPMGSFCKGETETPEVGMQSIGHFLVSFVENFEWLKLLRGYCPC